MPPSSGKEESNTFAAQMQRLEEGKRKDEFQNFRDRFSGLTEVEAILFNRPVDTPENQFACNAFDRLDNMPKYSQEREKIMLLMRRTAEKVFKALSDKYSKQGEIVDATRGELGELADEFYRHMLAVGQANKTINSPYTYSPEREDTIESSDQIFELNEIVLMRTAMESYAQLDAEEIIAMSTEDHGFVTMLIQERNLGEWALDPNEEEDKLDPRDPDKDKYEHNLKHLRTFILGHPTEDGKEKSKDRKGAEAVLWLEIVRGLTTEQKKDLVGVFLPPNGTLLEAQDFIAASVMANVMTLEEVEHFTRDYRQLGDNDFKKKLDAALAERNESMQEMAEAVDQIEHMRGQNFANEYLTFNNIVLGRVADLGMMTVAVNCILTVGDRIAKRSEPNRKEGLAKAFALGVGDTLKNKWFWAGMGVAAVGTNLVYPWYKDVALAKSEEEKTNGKKYSAWKYLKQEVGDNHERGDYLVENYNNWMRIAERHNSEGEGLVIYPDDLIEITPEEAGRLGCESVKKAQEEMAKLFVVCAVPLGKKDQGELDEYFKEKIFASIDLSNEKKLAIAREVNDNSQQK
jgi:hypothetical protein